jgi:diaminopimelate dehydrogenase
MEINNPALASQLMVGCARAARKQNPGAYTILELPVIDLLPGEREEWITKLI